MELLKKHSHEERMEIAEAMIPMLEEKFGDNFIALAACASVARGEDDDYSDLELMVFLKKMPTEEKYDAVAKVYDGMLIEIVWTTEKDYLESMGATKDWFLAGSDRLYPIVNRSFAERMNARMKKIEDLEGKCNRLAARQFKFETQEATSKVLNATKQGNRENLPLLLFDTYLHMLKTLSFLNKIPYKTFSTFVTQAKGFELKPEHFDDLTDMVVNGRFDNTQEVEETVETLFTEFESILKGMGFKLSDDNFDPRIRTEDYSE